MQTESGQGIRGPTDEGLGEEDDYFQGVEMDEGGPGEFVWP